MSEEQSRTSVLSAIWRSKSFAVLGRFLALGLVFLLFCALVEGGKFYSIRNLENILRQSAVYATAALGMTMVIVSAGIDLSIGSTIALSVVVVAAVLNINWTEVDQGQTQTIYLLHQYPTLLPIAAVLAGVAAATLAGLLNGVTIVYLRLVPFIVTLGTMGVFRGLAKGIAHEKDIYPPEDTWISSIMDPTVSTWHRWFTGESQTPPSGLGWLILPPGVWLMIIAALFAALLLRYTRFGRHVFAIGSNEETARLCGVPVGRTKILVYTLAGFFAGLAALMQFSFIGGIGQPNTAIAYELFVIAAVVIGGGSLMGGEGSVLGSVLGALIITILNMGGQQAGWPRWVQEMVIGAIIIAAVTVDQIRLRRSAA